MSKRPLYGFTLDFMPNGGPDNTPSFRLFAVQAGYEGRPEVMIDSVQHVAVNDLSKVIGDIVAIEMKRRREANE